MSRYAVVIAGVAVLTGLTLACTSDTSAPLAPGSAAASSATNTAADGSTLKVSAPVPQSPTGDQKLTGPPVLSAKPSVATFTGTPTLQYRFQVLDTANNVVQDSGLLNSLSFTVTAKLPGTTRHTWRVRSEFQGSVSPWGSTAASFISAVPFDIKNAVIYNNPPDFASWAETAKITSIDFVGGAFLVEFDKREGPGRWPDVGFGDGSLQYTLGMCGNIDGQWYCSAVVQFWHTRDLGASAPPDEIGREWFYDARWGRLLGFQPAWGETVGVYVAAGNLRDSGNVILKERSDIVLIPWGENYRP